MNPLNLGHPQCSHLPQIMGQHENKSTGEKLKESEEQMGQWEGKWHSLTNSYWLFYPSTVRHTEMEGRVWLSSWASRWDGGKAEDCDKALPNRMSVCLILKVSSRNEDGLGAGSGTNSKHVCQCTLSMGNSGKNVFGRLQKQREELHVLINFGRSLASKSSKSKEQLMRGWRVNGIPTLSSEVEGWVLNRVRAETVPQNRKTTEIKNSGWIHMENINLRHNSNETVQFPKM